MADLRWARRAPERGGVLQEFACDHPEGGTLTIEIRGDQSWLWIRNNGACRVLSFHDTDINTVLQRMSGVQDLPTIDNHLVYMSELGLALVAHEQFEQLFINELPEPRDASYFYFRDVLGDLAQGNPRAEFHARLGDPVPPSAYAALELGLAQLWSDGVRSGPRPNVAYDVDVETYPNPDLPRARVDFVLFRANESGWAPNAAVPPVETTKAIAEIANTGYSVADWSQQAAELAPRMASRWGEVLAVMVHGAPIPGGRDPFTWLQRLQTAAALVLAHLDAGWNGSLRRRALLHLALGPVDWAVQAAIIALYQLACETPEPRDEIEQLFYFLKGCAAGRGFTCYAPALAILWLHLGPRRIEADALRAWGNEAWFGGTDEVEGHGGLDLIGYAEHISGGAEPIAEWEARLEQDPSLRHAMHIQLGRAQLRAQLRQLDPASDQAMGLLRSFA